MPALNAVCALLQTQCVVMEDNEPGVLAQIDSECLHDYRVAVRRTRSLLGQLRQVFPDPPLQHFRMEFAWLGQITGPPRDLDVYLLGFPGYQNELPTERQGDLAPLRDFLLRQRRLEQQLLARHLGGQRYQKLLMEWPEWLQQSIRESPPGTPAARPIGEIAGRRIWKAFQRVISQGTAIGPESPAEALHVLRKSCKKLRYLLEFFASLYPDRALGKIVKALKGLQDNLGAYQDLVVQAEALRGFGEQMTIEGRVPPAAQQAMEILIEQLSLRQRNIRRQFTKGFAGFATGVNRERFQALLKADQRDGEK